MTVKELNQDQLDELKQAYICEMIENPSYSELAEAVNISNEFIYHHYDGYIFSSDDFCCSCGEYEPTADYDSLEDINKCLNCQKEDCDNCLKTINGV